MRYGVWAVLLAAITFIVAAPAFAGPRIKDVVDVQNVRENQLVGYGLVVGLAGTGDKMRNSPFTEASLQAMLDRMGVSTGGTQMRTQNVAAVTVTATLPPFARAGSRIDVQVSAIGDASSLQGGTLVVTELKGLDGQVYAVAQGPVAVSGFKAQGAAASISRGVSTSARVASGAIVEREIPYAFGSSDDLRLALKNPDFTTAQNVATAINANYPGLAMMIDPGTIQLRGNGQQLLNVLPQIENLTIDVDQPARIVVNEASGTVVMTDDVKVSPVAIAQGGLTISVSEYPEASQPAPLSNGQTVVLPRSDVSVDEGKTGSLAMVQGASLKELVGALNSLGVTPRDLITILQALSTAGALQAEIAVQ
jgi:flagellar P-ring protein FlgI